MKLKLAALLFAVAGMLKAQTPIDVTYRIINGATLPESMASSQENIGVIVFVRSWDPQVAKIEVRLEYSDQSGTHTINRTVDKVDGGRGHNVTPRPILFAIPLLTVKSIIAYGYLQSGSSVIIPTSQ